MNTPPAYVRGLMNMTASVEHYAHCNVLSNLPDVFGTVIWASNIANFALNEAMHTENQQQYAKSYINQLYTMIEYIDSNISTVREDHVNLSANDAWLIETCTYASNASGLRFKLDDIMNTRVGPIIEAAMFASNAYGWAQAQGFPCSNY